MKSKFNIAIYSLEAMVELISRKKTNLNIVSIRSSKMPEDVYEVFALFPKNFKSIIMEEFDDIESPEDVFIVPEEEHVSRILDWAKDKNNIAVHCTAGVSRSSAIAYLIACSKMPPSEAIKVLDWNYHSPNDLVILHGIKLLGNYSIYTEYIKWRQQADNHEPGPLAL